MSSAMWPLQQAVYSKLATDATLLTLVSAVYDGEVPPEKTPTFPYLVLGEMTEQGTDLLSRTGRTVTYVLHIFSRYQGFREAKIAGNRVIALLDRVSLTLVDNWKLVVHRYESAQTIQEPDGIRHNVIRMRAQLELSI